MRKNFLNNLIENWFDKPSTKDNSIKELPAEKSSLNGFSWKCNVCDQSNDSLIEDIAQAEHLRETLNCSECKSSSRKRHVVKVILGLFANQYKFLVEAVPDLSQISVYSTVSYDILHRFLGENNPNFVCSEFIPDIINGEMHNGVYRQNLEHLTFDDEKFDIVITEDVMEHVRHPEKAFREINRVLKPNGYHIFTIPFFMDKRTTSRVDTKTETDDFILPPEYHYDSRGKNVLVYTDWGYDIFDKLDTFGFSTSISWTLCRDTAINGIADSIIFFSRKTQKL